MLAVAIAAFEQVLAFESEQKTAEVEVDVPIPAIEVS